MDNGRVPDPTNHWALSLSEQAFFEVFYGHLVSWNVDMNIAPELCQWGLDSD